MYIEFCHKKTLDNALANCNNTATICLVENSDIEPNVLAYDGTADNNLRYVGANPNNYVSFKGELWRIIGVMNNITDSNGNVESHIKIIRNDPIGDYSYDNKANGTGSSNNDNGSSYWWDSALKVVLNGVYYNRSSGNCPNGAKGATKVCNFTNIGLTADSRNMIDSVVWNIGSVYLDYSVKDAYTAERGNRVYSNYGNREATWTGYVGLPYVTGAGYSVLGFSDTFCDKLTSDREKCLSNS